MLKQISVCLLAALVWAGCAGKERPDGNMPSGASSGSEAGQVATDSPSKASGGQKLIVTPGDGVTGRVATYNDAGRFVVLDFPLGRLPAMDQRLFVYRRGLKVGEVKITGPQKENHTVADLVQGEAQAGDEIRDK